MTERSIPPIVESMARAIAIAHRAYPDQIVDRHPYLHTTPIIQIRRWEYDIPAAMAALNALAEPDGEMVEAGFRACADRFVDTPDLAKAVGRDSFKAMIAAARGDH